MLCSRIVQKSASLALSVGLLLSVACGGEEELPPPPRVEVRIVDATSGGAIGEAQVLLTQGGVSQPMHRTNGSGLLSIEIPPGRYEVRVQAAGYLAAPRPFLPAPALTAVEGQTVELEVGLDPRASPAPGTLSGRVLRAGAAVPGALVVAASTVERASFTDAEGRFVLLDLPPGDYRVEALLQGHGGEALPAVRVPDQTEELSLELSTAAGVAVSGTLGAGAGPTTVALAHAGTGEPVPGLEATATTDAGFSIPGVPPGRYRVRAFLEADALVVSPDLIRELEDLEVLVESAPPASIELPVAPSMEILSPTLTGTVGADAEFLWRAHPEATFYVVEVENVLGQNLWGGFDARGVPRFRVLGSSTRIRYGAQGSPTEPLHLGHAYRFRVYAGLDVTTGEIFRLVAASEELAGQFRVTAD